MQHFLLISVNIDKSSMLTDDDFLKKILLDKLSLFN